MIEDKYDPRRFTEAMAAFKAHRAEASPETLEVLSGPGVAFHYTDALRFGFLSQDSDVFEQITRPESLEVLKRAAKAANYNVKLTLGPGIKEVLIEP